MCVCGHNRKRLQLHAAASGRSLNVDAENMTASFSQTDFGFHCLAETSSCFPENVDSISRGNIVAIQGYKIQTRVWGLFLSGRDGGV